MFRPRHAFILFLALFPVTLSHAQSTAPRVTPEWLYTEGIHVADLPQTLWLADNTAILFDTRQPESQRTFERLDPSTGQRTPVLNMSAALASLHSLAPDLQIKSALPWPASFDSAGQQALYEFNGDLFLLNLPSSTFTRVTQTPPRKRTPPFLQTAASSPSSVTTTFTSTPSPPNPNPASPLAPPPPRSMPPYLGFTGKK